MVRLVVAAAALLLAAAQAEAQRAQRSNPLGAFGSSGGGPIKVDANSLEVFDKENRAVYTGDVVAIRGKTTLRGSRLVIFYSRNNQTGQTNAGAGADAGAIRRIEVKGPVSIVCETQSATANELIYDATAKKLFLNGNAVVIDGPSNVLRGESIVYDTETGIANVAGGRSGRVQTVIDQGGNKQAEKSGKGCT